MQKYWQSPIYREGSEFREQISSSDRDKENNYWSKISAGLKNRGERSEMTSNERERLINEESAGLSSSRFSN